MILFASRFTIVQCHKLVRRSHAAGMWKDLLEGNCHVWKTRAAAKFPLQPLHSPWQGAAAAQPLIHMDIPVETWMLPRRLSLAAEDPLPCGPEPWHGKGTHARKLDAATCRGPSPGLLPGQAAAPLGSAPTAQNQARLYCCYVTYYCSRFLSAKMFRLSQLHYWSPEVLHVVNIQVLHVMLVVTVLSTYSSILYTHF
jgi:hypothetical protein